MLTCSTAALLSTCSSASLLRPLLLGPLATTSTLRRALGALPPGAAWFRHSLPPAMMSGMAAPQGGSVWDAVPQAPPDPVLGISDAFRKDTDPSKMNLGVGAYRTEEGKPLVLSAVKKAEARVVADPTANKEYQPITGNARFCELSRVLAFGADHPVIAQNRVCTVQALSGTGSLRVGAEFLQNHYPGPKVVYIPKPSWPTHVKVFRNAGMQVQEYRYFDPATRGLDFGGLMSDLSSAEPGSVLLLHACAHNPTGVDPTPEQWNSILGLTQRRRLLPFFDSAYQGFASGDLDRDAASVRMFAGTPGVEMILAQSYAKNMGLYGERVGALSVVANSSDNAKRVQGQLGLVIRPMYSNPPIHGAAIAQRIMEDPELLAEWKHELKGMADRINDMRATLFDALTARNAPGDWSFIKKQIGMFSFTGLTKAQCEHMTNKWHVYLTMDGRISMAGVRKSTAGRLADAIVDALKAAPSARM